MRKHQSLLVQTPRVNAWHVAAPSLLHSKHTSTSALFWQISKRLFSTKRIFAEKNRIQVVRSSMAERLLVGALVKLSAVNQFSRSPCEFSHDIQDEICPVFVVVSKTSADPCCITRTGMQLKERDVEALNAELRHRVIFNH